MTLLKVLHVWCISEGRGVCAGIGGVCVTNVTPGHIYIGIFTDIYISPYSLLLTFTHFLPTFYSLLPTKNQTCETTYTRWLFFTHTLPDILIIICTSKIAERIVIVQIILTKYHKKLRVNYTIFCVDKYCNNDTNRWLSIAYIRAGEIPFTVKTLCKAYVN